MQYCVRTYRTVLEVGSEVLAQLQVMGFKVMSSEVLAKLQALWCPLN